MTTDTNWQTMFMNQIGLNKIFSRMRSRKLLLFATLLIFAAVLFSAAIELDDTRPYGFNGAPEVYPSNLSGNNSVLYATRFDIDQFTGDLVARDIDQDGAITQDVNVADGNGNIYVATAGDFALWRAHEQLPAHGSRIIFTGKKVFKWDELGPKHQGLAGSEDLVNWVRGDDDKEGTGGNDFRVRDGVNHKGVSVHYILGDMPHSSVQYMGPPFQLIPDADYSQFRIDNKLRTPTLFVGANDGMLHAFRASDGLELFAYIPLSILPELGQLTDQNYTQSYFVDGTPTIADAKADFDPCPAGGGNPGDEKCWRTVLVGGLGSGGRGIYAIDVTDPAPANSAAAKDMYLWEFDIDDDDDLGFTFSRPAVAQLSDGTWVAIFGNGIQDSGTSPAELYIVDIEDGDLIQSLVLTPTSTVAPNGLLTPTVRDANFDGFADYVYAGDTEGNMWKIDIRQMTGASGGGPNPAESAYIDPGTSEQFPLAKVTGLDVDDNTVVSVIQTKPVVTTISDGTTIVIFGTGRLFGGDEALIGYGDSVYGILDNADPDTGHGIYYPPAASTTSDFVLTTYSPEVSDPTDVVRTISAGVGSSTVGWRFSLDSGERILTDPVLTNKRVLFSTIDPLFEGNNNWLNGVNYETGDAPDEAFLDITDDNVIDGSDLVSSQVPISLYMGHGVISGPTVANIDGVTDVNLVTRGLKRGDFVSPFSDPGLLGGHFDTDTFVTNDTKGCEAELKNGELDTGGGCHTHEYDDKWNVNGVNMLVADGEVVTEPDVETATGILSDKHTSFLDMMLEHPLADLTTNVTVSIVNPFSVDTPAFAQERANQGIDDNVVAPPAIIYFQCGAGTRIVEYAPDFNALPEVDRSCSQAGNITELRIKYSDINTLRATSPSCVKDNEVGPILGNAPDPANPLFGYNTSYRDGAIVVTVTTASGDVVYENANYEHFKSGNLLDENIPEGVSDDVDCGVAAEHLRAYKDPEEFGGNPVIPPSTPPPQGTPADPSATGDPTGDPSGTNPFGSIISEAETVTATAISSSRVSWREVLE